MQQRNYLRQPRVVYLSRLLRGVNLGISSLPWLWLGMFIFTVLVTTLQVGHWPSYNDPDPGVGGPATLVWLATFLLLPVTLATIPVWLGLVWATLIVSKLLRSFPACVRWYEVGIYLVGMMLCYLVIGKDITHLMLWFWD
jgi:hypothetical protein